MGNTIYAEPRTVVDLSDCYFYHTMDLPTVGLIRGFYDLRGGEPEYLGNVDVKGKRVLEIGTANGHLCFTMERMGAEVVAYDLSDQQEWDVIPCHCHDTNQHIAMMKEHIRQINNGFWFAHQAYQSSAKVIYGTVYEIPEEIGRFDMCTVSAVLLHLRDPFLALQKITQHIDDTVVVTDVVPADYTKFPKDFPWIHFLPNAERRESLETWWHLSPAVVREFLHLLGFPHTRVSFHNQKVTDKNDVPFYTVVGTRTSRHEPSSPAGSFDQQKYEDTMNKMALDNIRSTDLAKYLFKRVVRAIGRRCGLRKST